MKFPVASLLNHVTGSPQPRLAAHRTAVPRVVARRAEPMVRGASALQAPDIDEPSTSEVKDENYCGTSVGFSVPLGPALAAVWLKPTPLQASRAR